MAIFFGVGPDAIWDRFARLLFDWFRAPALEVTIKDNGQWAAIGKIGFLPLTRLKAEDKQRFVASLAAYTGREWRDTKLRSTARWSFATLVDAGEELAPSSIASLKHWSRVAARMGVEVEPIGKRDLAKLANYDALVHPPDHVDLQPHLPLRAACRTGGHAGHRRSAVHDPLHQQGFISTN